MSFSEGETERYEELVRAFVEKHRPPENIRNQVDIGFRIKGHGVEIVEIRPRYSDPKIIDDIPVAKTTYVRTQNVWKVFWMRSDLKWHGYDPPKVRTLKKFLELVDEDVWGCFWGQSRMVGSP